MSDTPCPSRQARDLSAGEPHGTGFPDTEIPETLRDVVERHRRHLARLVVSLRSAGIDEALVKQSIDILIDSYRAELSAAAIEMSKDPQRE